LFAVSQKSFTSSKNYGADPSYEERNRPSIVTERSIEHEEDEEDEKKKKQKKREEVQLVDVWSTGKSIF